ncbi:alpha/beta hydrolase [Streptomyces sp. NPDC054866]
MTDWPARPILEPQAQAFLADADPPFCFQMPLAQGRKTMEENQATPIAKPAVDEDWITVRGGPTGSVDLRIVRPARATGRLPVILYLHGGGWVFGNARTHDRLVRELATGARAAVVFPEYSPAPEHRYPVALEQSYTAARWITTDGASQNLDPARIAVAGDSAGANMAAALTLMTKQRGSLTLTAQVLFYPVTDAAFDTPSYHRFAEGFGLRRDAMQWFWNQYTTDETERAQITASPLRATTGQLTGLPPALIITAEADVLRDEGEAYAAKLRTAGVPVRAVRYTGIIHDFVVLNALRPTHAAEKAIRQATTYLATALHTHSPTEDLTATPLGHPGAAR